MRWKKTPVIIAGAILALILTAYLVLLSLDFNRFKPRIIQAVKQATGLDVTIHGDIKVGLGLTPNIVVHDIGIRNANWGSRPDSVRIKRCELDLALARLIRGVPQIERLIFVEPDFLLETNPSGEFNFGITHAREVSSPFSVPRPGDLPFFPVREARVERGRFTYRDSRSGASFSNEVNHLALSAPDMQSPIRVDMDGSVNARPLKVTGIFGSPAQVLDREQPWFLEISAKLDASTVTVQGTIDDVVKMKGFSLKTTAEGRSLNEGLAVAGISLPFDPGPFAFGAVMSDAHRGLKLKDILLRVGSAESQELEISGTVGDIVSLRGLQLKCRARWKDLSEIAGPFGTPFPFKGPFDLSGRIEDQAPKVFSFADVSLTLGEQEISGSAELNITGRFPRAKMEISSSGFDLTSVLAPGLGDSTWVGVLRGLGPLALRMSVADPFGNPGIEELDFRAGKEETAEIKIAGSAKKPLNLQGIELFWRFGGKDADKLEKLIGKPIPFKGPFLASGRFVDASRNLLSFDPIEMALGENRLSGAAEMHLGQEKIVIETNLSTRNISLLPVLKPGLLSPEFMRSLSGLGPVEMAFTVSDPAGMPAILEAKAVLGTQEIVEVKIAGSIRDLLSLEGIDLGLDIEGKDAARLDRIFGKPVPIRGAFALTGRARDPKPGIYRLEDLRAVLGRNEITGWVESKMGRDPFRLAAEFSSKSLDPAVLLKEGEAEEARDIWPWSLGTGIAVYEDRFSVESLRLVLGTPDLAEAVATGAVSDLFQWQGVDLQCSLKGRDLSKLLELIGAPFPLIGAFDISGKLIDPKAGMYKVKGFEARVGDNDLAGSFDLDLTQAKPRLTAGISSRKFDLRPLLEKHARASEKESGESGKPRQKVFPADPLSLHSLEMMNGRVRMTAGQILFPGLALDDVSAEIAIQEGDLVLHPFRCAIGGGTVEGLFDLKKGGSQPMAGLQLRAERIDIGAMLDELGVKKPLEGILGVDIAVAAQGHSISALMAGLNGTVVSVQQEGRIHGRYMDALGRGLIQEILRVVNPFSAKEEYSELNCAVHVFDIKDGLATCKRSLADTRYTTLRGRGQVDLKEERLDLLFGLSPKKGIGISGVAEVGVSLPGLARSFKLGGTLAQPSLTINPGGAAGTIGKMLGGLALLGPLGLTAGLLDLRLGENDPCFEILKEMETGNFSPEALEKATPTHKYRPVPPNPHSEEHQGP